VKKRRFKINPKDNWIVAFSTTGLLATMIGFVGVVQWITTNFNLSLEGFPVKDIVQLGLGIVFLVLAAQLQEQKESKSKA